MCWIRPDKKNIGRYKSENAMREQYMRNGEGFVLVYSINSHHSFEEIQTFYEQIRRVKDRDDFPIVLVGNKCDLEHDRRVSYQEGRDLAKQYNCPFLETSAKQRIKVDDIFYDIVREIRRMNKEQEARTKGHHREAFGMDDGGDSRSCCCVIM
ncbi:Ras GTPase [Apophysomyces ossiformis]|uniref:Ras GTPase n=1 Tax=Apophysomyces ossiformis TaxID=679940 RepID=A0A8H7EKI6_9FUNG|nr:Ras GTPase [Apophysomyces ossiformis]